MAESLTTLFVAATLFAALRYRRNRRGAGGVAGRGDRPGRPRRAESVLLLPLVVAPLVWATRARWRERARDAVLAGAVAAALLAPG
ncbi:MAG: hypothetical protein R2695_05660 [Acidimicrobiales bacterium]